MPTIQTILSAVFVFMLAVVFEEAVRYWRMK